MPPSPAVCDVTWSFALYVFVAVTFPSPSVAVRAVRRVARTSRLHRQDRSPTPDPHRNTRTPTCPAGSVTLVIRPAPFRANVTFRPALSVTVSGRPLASSATVSVFPCRLLTESSAPDEENVYIVPFFNSATYPEPDSVKVVKFPACGVNAPLDPADASTRPSPQSRSAVPTADFVTTWVSRSTTGQDPVPRPGRRRIVRPGHRERWTRLRHREVRNEPEVTDTGSTGSPAFDW